MLSKKGFTLIELLIVIAIIAILAVAGFAAYRGLAGKGNDSKRQTDIIAIATALEANKSALGYQALANNQFGSSVVPTDPVGGNNHVYCMSANTTGNNNAVPAALTDFLSGGSCKAAGSMSFGANDAPWVPIAPGVPTQSGGNITIWMICTALDNPVNGSNIFCKLSTQ